MCMCNSCRIGEVVQSDPLFDDYLGHMLEKVKNPSPNAVIIAHFY